MTNDQSTLNISKTKYLVRSIDRSVVLAKIRMVYYKQFIQWPKKPIQISWQVINKQFMYVYMTKCNSNGPVIPKNFIQFTKLTFIKCMQIKHIYVIIFFSLWLNHKYDDSLSEESLGLPSRVHR